MNEFKKKVKENKNICCVCKKSPAQDYFMEKRKRKE